MCMQGQSSSDSLTRNGARPSKVSVRALQQGASWSCLQRRRNSTTYICTSATETVLWSAWAADTTTEKTRTVSIHWNMVGLAHAHQIQKQNRSAPTTEITGVTCGSPVNHPHILSAHLTHQDRHSRIAPLRCADCGPTSAEETKDEGWSTHAGRRASGNMRRK